MALNYTKGNNSIGGVWAYTNTSIKMELANGGKGYPVDITNLLVERHLK